MKSQPEMTKRFLIIGGKVGDSYIVAEAVAQLYKLNLNECVLVNEYDLENDYFKLTKAKWDEKYGELQTFRPDPIGRYQLPRGAR